MKKPIMNNSLCAIASLALLLVGTAPVRANLIAYEGFDHTPAVIGNLTGLSGGTNYPDYGWAGAWVHNYQAGDDSSAIASGSITRTGVSSYGNKVKLYRNMSRSLTTAVGGASGTVWCGVFFNAGTTKGTAYFRLLSNTTTVLNIYSKPGSNITLDGISSGVLASTGTQFHLIRIDFSPAGNTAYLWINPGLSSEPETATAHATATYPGNWTFNKVRVENTSAVSNYTLSDEIRIGTTFRDALKPIGPPDETIIVVR